MSKCPDCGRENVQPPAGSKQLCGRYATFNDSPGVQYPHPYQWRERMLMAQACKQACALTLSNGDSQCP